jgi:hypothetical protein
LLLAGLSTDAKILATMMSDQQSDRAGVTLEQPASHQADRYYVHSPSLMCLTARETIGVEEKRAGRR